MSTMALSQVKRLRCAVDELRAVSVGRLLPSKEDRSMYAKHLFRERWVERTFRITSARAYNPGWRGHELDLLFEVSHYILPAAKWAKRRQSGESWARRETAWTLLALVQHKMGREAAKVLRSAYVKNGVKYRPRRVLSAVQRAKLAAQFAKPEPGPEPKIMLLRALRSSTSTEPPHPTRRRINFDDE